MVGENIAAVVLALALDMHTFPKCPLFPQLLHTELRAEQFLLL